MVKIIFKSLSLLALFLMLSAQQGCQTTSMVGKKISAKEEVKQKMILEVQTEIKELGATPLTENEAKYKGKLGKDKYIKALQDQLAELKAEKEKEKAEARKKADAEKKEKNRVKVIESIKKEILFLGETPLAEFEFTTEDKYISALRKRNNCRR